MLEVARGLDSWHRPEGSRPLGMRMEATRNVASTLYLQISITSAKKPLRNRTKCEQIDILFVISKSEMTACK